ncbi:MAG TPA: thiamine pyrophosphate-binding protein [Candidatus Kryptonia bacterium]|nr:thiamine pyrophosphate-binding protein [Candidatus Kryptonia bacterium]
MKRRMALGDFLTAYLQKLGVSHLFGIPGDLVLRLFFRFGRRRNLRMVTFSHEPGVGFAADGYARASGRIGVVCVTYGAGGHNMVNPVAGSFSERVPILVVSGGPGEEERKLGTLIHHQAREIESQYHIYRELTCAAKVLTDPRTAADDVDEVVRAMWVNQRPGYLEVHRDMVDRVIDVPRSIIEWDGRLAFPHSDERKLTEAVRDTTERFNRAKRPVMVFGIETYRYRLANPIVELAERMGVPVLTSVLGKGAFPMDHPLHMGVHIGPLSPPAIRRRIDRADLVLNLGTLHTDMNLGSRPPQRDRLRSVWAVDNRVDISYHTYTDVMLRDFVKELIKAPLRRHRETVRYADNLVGRVAPKTGRLLVAEVLREVNRFLADKPDYLVVAESGDMLFAGLDVRVPGRTGYLAQGYYASMGFGVPGALGAQMGSGRRPLVLCGDGAFQMTGPEIAQAPRHGLNPIVVLMNNGGWGIFRPVAERQDLLTVPRWPYADLARAWGGAGWTATSADELRLALAEAAHRPSFGIIEVIVDEHDLSPVTRKYIAAVAHRRQSTASK